MTKSLRDKYHDNPSECIMAWWRDQSEDLQMSMQAFDNMPEDIRKAVNDYPLNVLPKTVLLAIKIWGKDRILTFLRESKP